MKCPNCGKNIRGITQRVGFGPDAPHEHLAKPCGHPLSCDLALVLTTAWARRDGLLGKGQRLNYPGMCLTGPLEQVAP